MNDDEELNIIFFVIFNLSEPTQSAILTSMKVGVSSEKHGAQTYHAGEAWSRRVLKIAKNIIFNSDEQNIGINFSSKNYSPTTQSTKAPKLPKTQDENHLLQIPSPQYSPNTT